MSIKEVILIKIEETNISLYIKNLQNLLLLLNNLSQKEKEIVNVSHIGVELKEIANNIDAFKDNIILPKEMLKSFFDALNAVEWILKDENLFSKESKNNINTFKQLTKKIKKGIEEYIK